MYWTEAVRGAWEGKGEGKWSRGLAPGAQELGRLVGRRSAGVVAERLASASHTRIKG